MKEPKGKPPSHLLLCSDFIRAGAAEADRDECAVNAAEAAAAAARAASSIVIAFSPRPSNRTGRKIERVITTVAAKEKKKRILLLVAAALLLTPRECARFFMQEVGGAGRLSEDGCASAYKESLACEFQEISNDFRFDGISDASLAHTST